MSMSVYDLHSILEELIENGEGEKEVLFLAQPSWPFVYSIKGVGTHPSQENKILLVEGWQLKYGPKHEEVEEF